MRNGNKKRNLVFLRTLSTFGLGEVFSSADLSHRSGLLTTMQVALLLRASPDLVETDTSTTPYTYRRTSSEVTSDRLPVPVVYRDSPEYRLTSFYRLREWVAGLPEGYSFTVCDAADRVGVKPDTARGYLTAMKKQELLILERNGRRYWWRRTEVKP